MANKTNTTKGNSEYFRVTGDYGRDSSGKRIRKEFYGKNKKDAEAKKEAYENALNAGLGFNHDKNVFGEIMRTWLNDVMRLKIRAASYERYEGIYRLYIEDSPLHLMKLVDMKTVVFQRYYNQLHEDGKTYNQIFNLNKLIKSFLFYCIEQDYILKNPLKSKNLTIPGKRERPDDDKSITVFDDMELKQLKSSLADHRLRLLILMASSTGLRIGELLALKWSDIHDGQVHVSKSLRSVAKIKDGKRKYVLVLMPPKTKASYRSVPYPSLLEAEILKHKARQAEEKLKIGSKYHADDYVFTTPIGTAIDPHNLRSIWRRILNNAGLEYKKFHSLRHTYATMLFMDNIPPKTVQELMGHSNISTTMQIYTHVLPKQKTDAAEVLNRHLL